MRERVNAWIIGWSEDLWPSHWPARMFLTGMLAGAVISLAVLAVSLIYSSLAG